MTIDVALATPMRGDAAKQPPQSTRELSKEHSLNQPSLFVHDFNLLTNTARTHVRGPERARAARTCAPPAIPARTPAPKASASTTRTQQIIDYPRHLHFSSDFKSVADAHHVIRRQKVFHRDFEPRMNDAHHRNLTEKLNASAYISNQIGNLEEANEYVTEFVKRRNATERQQARLQKIKQKERAAMDKLTRQGGATARSSMP